MSIGYSDIWVGERDYSGNSTGGVDQGWVGTVLPKVLLRWMPSRLSPLVVAAVSAAAAAAADDDDDDDGGGGGGDDDDDDDHASYLRSTWGTWSMYRALDLPHSVASTCEPRPAVHRRGR